MRHPLELTKRADRTEVLRQYFCLFWEMAASKREAPAGSIPATISRTLSSPDCVKELAKEFADSLASPLIPIISVRILRSIVGRLFSKATYDLRTTKLPTDKKRVERISKSLDSWIVEIFKELGPEIRTEGLF